MQLTGIAPVSACVLGADLAPEEAAAIRSHGVQVRTVASGASAGLSARGADAS